MLNKWCGIGNLGADVETRTFQNGNKVANFRIACTERWKDKSGEKQERTEWVSIAVFSEGLVRVCEQYLKKGSSVYIEGKLQTRKWQDQSGNDRYSTEVVLQGFDSKLVMLGGGNTQGGNQGSHNEQGGGYSGGGGGGSLDDEVPFHAEFR